MKMLLPLILLVIGTGGGIGAGLFLQPSAEETAATAEIGPCGPLPGEGEDHAASDAHDAEAAPDAMAEGGVANKEYARLNNQFVIPVVREGRVAALVVISLSVEVPAGQQALVFEHEPKLRDVFLQVLFDHANLGGFDGAFTATSNMRTLRTALRNAARDAIGDQVSDVLILEMVRQDT